MKNKKQKADYSQLKKKLFFRMLLMFAASIIIILAFYNLIWSGRGSEFIVSCFVYLFNLRYETALSIYQSLFRNHAEFLMLTAMIVVFFFLLRASLNWIFKYFDFVNAGIDSLLSDDEQISLPSDLLAVERKLNAVKQTLKQQSLETKLAEQRKNDLVMYLAHDIRTPLTSVIGYLNLLDELPKMPPEQRARYVHITLEKAYRLEKMIDEFFEITRYNIQQISLTKETIDLYYMLVQLSDELSPLLSANHNTARLHADENLTIYGDPDKLARVFNNVLKNAAAYSYPNTEIIISAEQKEQTIIISFKNKGRTIPKEKLSAIFEKFYRLDEARATNNGGAGLGLAIAKEIVTIHGGSITANSENETTVFQITLPVVS